MDIIIIVQRIRLNTSPDQDAIYIKLAGCYKRPANLREMPNTAKQYDCSLYLITIEPVGNFHHELEASVRAQNCQRPPHLHWNELTGGGLKLTYLALKENLYYGIIQQLIGI